MSKETRLEATIREYEGDVDFVFDAVLMRLNEAIVREMKERGVTRSELAKLLGTSKAYITRLLRGDANPTLRSLVRLSLALGATPAVTLHAKHNRPSHVRSAAPATAIPFLPPRSGSAKRKAS